MPANRTCKLHSACSKHEMKMLCLYQLLQECCYPIQILSSKLGIKLMAYNEAPKLLNFTMFFLHGPSLRQSAIGTSTCVCTYNTTLGRFKARPWASPKDANLHCFGAKSHEIRRTGHVWQIRLSNKPGCIQAKNLNDCTAGSKMGTNRAP